MFVVIASLAEWVSWFRQTLKWPLIACNAIWIFGSLHSFQGAGFQLANNTDHTILAGLLLDANKVGVMGWNYMVEAAFWAFVDYLWTCVNLQLANQLGGGAALTLVFKFPVKDSSHLSWRCSFYNTRVLWWILIEGRWAFHKPSVLIFTLSDFFSRWRLENVFLGNFEFFFFLLYLRVLMFL